MKVIVIPGIAALTDDRRFVPADGATEADASTIVSELRKAIESGRPLIERFDRAYVVELPANADLRGLPGRVERRYACAQCGVEINPRAMYCSARCRQAVLRERRCRDRII